MMPLTTENPETYFRVEFMQAHPKLFYQTADGSWRIYTTVPR